MSFLSRLFGAKPALRPTGDIESQLLKLEAEADDAKPGYVGTAHNKAGDLALKTEQPDRAAEYYGRAIDAFLEDEQRELARGVANKIIRVRPTAIRTLRTLTWLDLAARHQAIALMHLQDYVAAAKKAGQGPRAATQIHEMARLCADSEFVDAVADALDQLDFGNRAREVRGWASSSAPGAISDGDALSSACLKAARGFNPLAAELLNDEIEGAASALEEPSVDELSADSGVASEDSAGAA